MTRGPALLIFAFVGSLAGSAVATPPANRWPRWPTELAQTEAALRDQHSAVSARHVALASLDPYATAVVEPLLLLATQDRADDVRQAAFERCVHRELTSCVPLARQAWLRHGTLLLRMSVLKVLALAPRGPDLAILLDALRDPDDSMRAHAAQLVGQAHFLPDDLEAARAALRSKLADPSATVRKIAVESLGEIGPGQGSLALVKLLDDADPVVREATASALDHCRDPRFLPALHRSLVRGGSSHLMLNVLRGIVNSPTPDAEPILLAALDRPPSALRRHEVAAVLALRTQPSAAFIDGLVARTHDDVLRDNAIEILMALGPATIEPLERARERGLAPGIDAELASIIATHRRSDTNWSPPPEPLPSSSTDWPQRLLDDDPKRRNEALRQLPPDAWSWAWGHTTLATRQGFAIGTTLAYLTAALRRPPPSSAVRPHHLGALAHYADSEPDDHCLAWVLLAVVSDADNRTLDTALTNPHRARRRCAALAAGIGQREDLVVQALHDPSPRVRSTAAYASSQLHNWSSTLPTLLTILSHADPDGRVRVNARYALDQRTSSHDASTVWHVEWVEPSTSPRAPTNAASSHTQLVVENERAVFVPTFATTLGRWWLVPAP